MKKDPNSSFASTRSLWNQGSKFFPVPLLAENPIKLRAPLPKLPSSEGSLARSPQNLIEIQAKEKQEKGRCHKDQLDLCASKQKIQSTMSSLGIQPESRQEKK
jgi:hypothetical protein